MYKVGNVGFQLGGLINYLKAEKVLWNYALPLVGIGAVAAFIGGNIVLSVDETLLSKIIGLALFLFVPLSVFNPKLGIVARTVGIKSKTIGYCLYFLSSIWGSSFAIGAGLFNMINQTYFFGMTLLQVKGTAKIPGAVKSIIVLILFAHAGIVNWQLSLIFLVGMFLGSLLGTVYTIRIGDTWLRYFLLVTVFVLSIKLIFGY